jgi:hypothetical protein
VLDQLPDLVLILVAAAASYLFGRRQAEHERLYEERAKAIAGLFERIVVVDQRFHSLVSPIDWAGEPDKCEKGRLAAEAFNELLAHYRRNSIWLSRRASTQMSAFIERYRQTFQDFRGTDPTYRFMPSEWDDIWRRFEKESPEIRASLEEEFRAALGDTQAKLRLFR